MINKNISKWKIEESKQDDIYWDDRRLKRILRLIIYFSIILPNKFLSHFKNDPIFEKILGADKSIL